MLATLTAFFTTALVVSNLTASKLVEVKLPIVGGIVFPAAVLAYALTFVFTDVVSEIWGKRQARNVVIIGLGANILALVLVVFSVLLPAAPFQKDYEQVFNLVFSFSPGIIAASMIAYLVSQLNDVLLFHKLREATKGRHLWLRNNISTMTSQFIDTVIFITLAFSILPIIIVGTPILPLAEIPRLILGQYIIKLIIAVLDTPLVYGLVFIIKR